MGFCNWFTARSWFATPEEATESDLQRARELLDGLPQRPWRVSAFVNKFEIFDKYGSEIRPGGDMCEFLSLLPNVLEILEKSQSEEESAERLRRLEAFDDDVELLTKHDGTHLAAITGIRQAVEDVRAALAAPQAGEKT